MKIAGLISFVMIFVTAAFAQPLYPDYYDKACPQACKRFRGYVKYMQGCDASLLLDSTPHFVSEKFATPNNNSARGFEVIDRIKSEVDQACGGTVVSCADILAVAARDSVVALGGPSWEVLLERRDATYANITAANVDIPAPSLDLTGLIASFQNQGLDVNDLVAFSGGHTLGFAQCRFFLDRIYNDTNIDTEIQRQLQTICPLDRGDANLHSLDPTPAFFDTEYFRNIPAKRALLHSDQALLGSPETDGVVAAYRLSGDAFAKDFAISIMKMGNIKPLTGDQGQIRYNCRRVN
ncbi:Peroxidase [Handroanthus impetiginosus]|uniref:Peroxidase n=1 Tax=Handroanthus impetiginosus TaxID=429701 RepID=A0A2G9H2F2_9LAMI|nr:Peroxidase [Handroanthus impetiginosus]